MGQNLFVGPAFRRHDGGTYLAEPCAMTPAMTAKNPLWLSTFDFRLSTYLKPTAVQTCLAEPEAYLQFFADNLRVLGADNLQAVNTPRRTAVERNKVDDLSEVNA